MATVICKPLIISLRPAIDAALASLAEAHGITLKAGNCSFDPKAGCFTFKLAGVAIGAPGKDAARYDEFASMLALPVRGTVFKGAPRNTEYRTDGINSTASKVICERVSDGKKFLIPVEFVQAACRGAVLAASDEAANAAAEARAS